MAAQADQFLEIFVLYLVLGVLAGVVAGLFGLGGGVIIVPVLIAAFTASAYPAATLTHLAIGTSLATIVVTSISAIATHQQNVAVRWPLVVSMIPGIVLGAGLGGLLAARLNGPLLQICFGVFLIFVAVQMVSSRPVHGHRDLPGLGWRFSVAGVIGCLSGIFGIGGGSLTVPFLSWCRVPMPQAVASSAALGFPIALSATCVYVMSGWQQTGLPAGAYGYVYMPAFIGITLTSIPFARIGARLAHRLPELGLRRAFSVLSLLLGLIFIVSNVGS